MATDLYTAEGLAYWHIVSILALFTPIFFS